MATDIPLANLKEPIDFAEYLFTRIKQLGIQSIHGLPGDYNLVTLDYVPKVGLTWAGNVNELNAGYAADGYARVKGAGCVVTTFGVGELSAVNALAGCYSEFVPVAHIVGTPSTRSIRNNMLLHHTLGNGDFNVFANMSKQISCAVANLFEPHDAAQQVDNVLREMMLQSRPVYITVPSDLSSKKVEGERLKTPIDFSYPANDLEKEEYVVDVVLKYLHAAKNPVILVDACAIRHRAVAETNEFVRKSGLPTFCAPMGKGAVDETLPNYGGVYAGDGSNENVREIVESSDLVLSIGAIKSDFNTTGFTYQISQLQTIDFHSNYVRVRWSEYPGIRMNGVLKKVTERMGKLNVSPTPAFSNKVAAVDQGDLNGEITQAWLWPTVGQWLQPHDVVLTETGTANFGIWETRFPKGVVAASQVLWGSIGWSVGACQGAALAAKELGDNRTILFVGDGSFQLGAQEVSTMIRRNLKPIIFCICNDGYTIERFIHGEDAEYNDIQEWKNKELLNVFGADPKKSKTFTVKTKQQLLDLFADKEFSSAPYIQFVELYMPKMDAPKSLAITCEVAAKNNAKQ
ncbi:pyruvate decarboxylase [Xylona heveae TC161]|uniref:Pyruvate decarboxylase n=1 Tax=Xylona heveae (strain CBS 132557 / TC161) TaxID=1328760 RepID=A0A164ZAI6_XYLHT|nr:pyruvate decarboxylase [Xylona heveae TC161]KZF18872.1 pyruvate decarboxylase [Xylona heveae TC161]